MNIDKMVEEIAEHIWSSGKTYIGPSVPNLTEFANKLLARIAETETPVAWAMQDVEADYRGWVACRSVQGGEFQVPLFAHPPKPDTEELEALRKLLEECRSSVKFDLITYEKKSRAYKNLGPEGLTNHLVAEAEANRLHGLLIGIDQALGLEEE